LSIFTNQGSSFGHFHETAFDKEKSGLPVTDKPPKYCHIPNEKLLTAWGPAFLPQMAEAPRRFSRRGASLVAAYGKRRVDIN
jgi:hypothetical protein